MLITDAEASLDAFFQDSSRKVLLLKGPWGVGKSYFVRYYLASPNSKSPIYQHFVSLFGLSSLNEVKEMINACLERRTTSKAVAAAQKHSKAILGVATQIKKASETLVPKGVTVATDLVSAVGTSLFWQHVKARESVIVFDDLERSSLSVDAILGLASSLAENSKAKILIICNEDQLDELRLKLLNVYREKLIDSEILFKPLFADIVNRYLADKSLLPDIVDLFQRIDSHNIRLLAKINGHLKLLSDAMRREKLSLDKDDLIQAAKIVCLRYLSRQPIRHDRLHDAVFAGVFGKRKKDATEEEREFSELSDKLKLFPGTVFDDLSLELLQKGYITEPSLETFRKKYKENSDRGQYDHDIRKAYANYGDNFTASVGDVIKDIKAFLDEYSGKIQSSDLVSHLTFLKNVGYKGSPSPWIKKHLVLLDRIPDPLDRVQAARTLPSSTLTKRYIADTLKSIPPIKNPLELIRKINKAHGWNDKETQALNEMTQKQILHLVCGSETDTIDAIRDIYKSWRGNNGPAGEFAKKIDAALTVLEKRSKLNALRVQNLFRRD